MTEALQAQIAVRQLSPESAEKFFADNGYPQQDLEHAGTYAAIPGGHAMEFETDEIGRFNVLSALVDAVAVMRRDANAPDGERRIRIDYYPGISSAPYEESRVALFGAATALAQTIEGKVIVSKLSAERRTQSYFGSSQTV